MTSSSGGKRQAKCQPCQQQGDTQGVLLISYRAMLLQNTAAGTQYQMDRTHSCCLSAVAHSNHVAKRPVLYNCRAVHGEVVRRRRRTDITSSRACLVDIAPTEHVGQRVPYMQARHPWSGVGYLRSQPVSVTAHANRPCNCRVLLIRQGKCRMSERDKQQIMRVGSHAFCLWSAPR